MTSSGAALKLTESQSQRLVFSINFCKEPCYQVMAATPDFLLWLKLKDKLKMAGLADF